jgi:hypothetical protein
MPTYTNSWDEASPAGSSALSSGDDAIRQLKLDVRERLNTDHYYPATDVANTGYHRQVTLPEGADPASVANAGIAYTKDVSGRTELFYEDDTGAKLQLTSAGLLRLAAASTSDVDNRLVPVGAIILWDGAICPTGWTRVSALDGKFLVGDTSYNAAAGGSNTITPTGTNAAEAAHTHVVSRDGWGEGGATPFSGRLLTTDPEGNNQVAANDRTSGAGTSHNHAFTGDSFDNRPAYATVLLCKKS